MRKFEVTLTYKPRKVYLVPYREVFIKLQKVLDVELDDCYCSSPEEFCDSVLLNKDRARIVRLIVKERYSGDEFPLHWIHEHWGRIYFYNGIPLIPSRN
jgi:hypothetical protein